MVCLRVVTAAIVLKTSVSIMPCTVAVCQFCYQRSSSTLIKSLASFLSETNPPGVAVALSALVTDTLNILYNAKDPPLESAVIVRRGQVTDFTAFQMEDVRFKVETVKSVVALCNTGQRVLLLGLPDMHPHGCTTARHCSLPHEFTRRPISQHSAHSSSFQRPYRLHFTVQAPCNPACCGTAVAISTWTRYGSWHDNHTT